MQFRLRVATGSPSVEKLILGYPAHRYRSQRYHELHPRGHLWSCRSQDAERCVRWDDTGCLAVEHRLQIDLDLEAVHVGYDEEVRAERHRTEHRRARLSFGDARRKRRPIAQGPDCVELSEDLDSPRREPGAEDERARIVHGFQVRLSESDVRAGHEDREAAPANSRVCSR